MSTGHITKSHFFKADRREELLSANAATYVAWTEFVCVEDIFLKPASTMRVWEDQGAFILIPLVGSLLVKKEDQQQELRSEELLVLKKEIYEVVNPWNSDTVNFLKLVIKDLEDPAGTKTSFELIQKNVLVRSKALSREISVGVFDSRTKSSYQASSGAKGVCAFVINGSFEIEDRLAEHRDTLILKDVEKIEFESLSELAVLLIIEF